MNHSCHHLFRRGLLMAALLMATIAVAPALVCAADAAPAKIGIIGAGEIGGTLARLWVKAGYQVLISSRHPEELRSLAQSLASH
jgi:glutamyl-tRNA reductase